MSRRAPDRVYRRRRAVAGAGACAVLGLGGLAAAALVRSAAEDSPGAERAQATPTPTPPPVLPRGGRSVLPEFRVVGFYGAPQHAELGALGIGTPDAAARRLARQARPYGRPQQPVLPALELIVSIATAAPGADGMFRMQQPHAVIRRYLRAARRHKMLLLLDIQGGRSDFFAEAQRLERYLEQPDVGLALDPEWRVAEGQLPGKVIGSVSAREINAVSAWLAQIVAAKQLPQKLLVVHQFTFDMIRERERLKTRPELDIVLNADGFGGHAIKQAKYRDFTRRAAPGFHDGFKIFYREDTDLMSPREVLRLRPRPAFVVYE